MEKEQTEHSNKAALIIAIVSSLSAGFIDSLLAGSTEFISFTILLALPVTTVIIFFFVYVILWFTLINRAGDFLKLKKVPLAISFSLFLLTIVIRFSEPFNYPLFPFNIFILLKLFILLLISSVIAIAAYFIARAVAGIPEYRKTFTALCFAIPFLLAETMVLIWLYRYLVWPSFSLHFITLITCYILFVVFTFIVFFRLNQTPILTRLLISFMIIVALSPFAALVITKVFKNYSEDSKNKEHKIKHVILISVDTLRTKALSCYGSQEVLTPHIDSLANDGILFTDAISSASWTLPSVTSIMTGFSPLVHLTTLPDNRLSDSFKTLAEYMHDDGYFTAAIGHNEVLKPRYNISQGFNEYDFFPKRFGPSFGMRVLKRLFPNDFLPVPSTSDLTMLVIDWLKTNSGKDFFLWIHFFDPHLPYSPPREYIPKIKPPASIGYSFSNLKAVRDKIFIPSNEEKKWIKILYESEVRYVDRNIGKLLDTLKSLKLYNDSLIIFTSDHGEELWEHGGLEHGHTLYNELLRVPLIIKLPLLTSENQRNETVSTQGIMPAILDICGINHSNPSNTSVASLCAPDTDAYREQPIIGINIINRHKYQESVMFNNTKYILYNYNMPKNEELYDLASDPGEMESILSSSQDKVKEAKKILKDYHNRSEKIRKFFGLKESEKIFLDAKTRQELKTLCYLK